MDWVVGSERHFHYVFQLSFYEIRFVCGYGLLRVIDELIAYKVVTIRYHHMQNVWIKYCCSGFTNFSCVIFWCKHNYHMVTATNVNLYYLIMLPRVWTFENILYSNKVFFLNKSNFQRNDAWLQYYFQKQNGTCIRFWTT